MTVDTSSLLALDVETTGPDPTIHQLLAASFVPVDSGTPPLSVYVRADTFVWTDVGKQYFARYSADWGARAERPEKVLRTVSEYLERWFSSKELLLVGHNVGFDLSFLKQLAGGSSLPRISHRTIDTHTMLKLLAWLGRVPQSACSSSGAFEYFGLAPPESERHTSLGDALATRDLFLRLLGEFDASCISTRAFS